MNFYTLYQGNITNAENFGKINNLVDMVSAFKDQLHYQSIVDIVTEGKYIQQGGMILLTQIRKKLYNSQPSNSTWNVTSFL